MSRRRKSMKHLAEPSPEEREAILAAAAGRRGTASLRRSVTVLEQELAAERAARELGIRWRDERPQVHRIEPLKLPRRGRPGGLPHLVTVSLASDWHVDERVDPATVNGLNDYGPEEAERRMDYYWRSVCKLVAKEQAHSDVRTHVQWIGGDLFSGHIHEDLVEITSMAPMESIFWLRERVTAGLKFLCENLDVEELVVVWQFGNHGRDGKKPRIATAAQHNYEWMLGQFMQQDILREPWAKKRRLRFIAERGYHTYLDLDGYVVRFHHGEGIRFQGGVGGLSIPLNKAISKWNEARHAHLDVLGHWHQETDTASAVVNGSLIGHNAYGVSIKAGFEIPKQGFFEVDLARRAKTGYFSVHVIPKPAVRR